MTAASPSRSWTGAIVLVMLMTVVLSAIGTVPPRPEGVREAGLDEVEKLIRDRTDVAVLDVRTASEYSEQGHLPKAQLLDFFRDDFDAALDSLKLDPAKPCIVYCAIGGRAGQAAERLVKRGFKDIILPKGSFKAWKAAGKTIEGAPKK